MDPNRERVLLVDDREVNLVAMEAALGSLPVTCHSARSGEEALELAQERDFAAIILDVHLPKIDGFETARRLKSSPKTRDVPIIFLSAFSKQVEDMLHGYETGAVDYLSKPFLPKVLAGKVAVFASIRSQRRVIESQALDLREHVRRLTETLDALVRKDQSLRELERARSALLESEEKFRTLVNNIPGVCYRRKHDAAWTMLYLSEQVRELAGSALDEAQPGDGPRFIDLVHPDDREAACAEIEAAIQRGRPHVAEYRIVAPDGRIRWTRDRGKASRAHDGTVRWIDGVIVDVTEAKSAEEQLVRAKESAEAANRAKSAFLANMSHELRTPLHGILSFAGFGITRHATVSKEKIRYYFEQVRSSGQTLLNLLNELLDLAKLESGKMSFDFKPTDVSFLASAVTDEFASYVAERSVSVVIDPVAAGDSFTAVADDDRLKQVLRNLLGNAVKFSPPGGTVTVRVLRDGDRIGVEVEDQGPGIPPAELESVFEKFIQSSRTQTGAGGTGLGLAICREIVHAHRGRIWARNNAVAGATFRFDLAAAHEPSCGAAEAAVVQSAEMEG